MARVCPGVPNFEKGKMALGAVFIGAILTNFSNRTLAASGISLRLVSSKDPCVLVVKTEWTVH